MKEIIFECNNYSGNASEERCRTIEDYVKERIGDKCILKNVHMKETSIQDNMLQPTLILRYEDGDAESLINDLDQILLEIGIVAIKAVVSEVASRAVESALVGGGAGLLTGGTKGSDALATTLIGALIGGLIGSALEKRKIKLVATKSANEWISESISA